MRRLARLSSLACTLMLGGCVGSLYTLWSGPDMVMDRRLLGAWRDSSSAEWMEVGAAGPFSYRIVFHGDSGKTGRFVALLGHIGGRLVLDVQPDVTELNKPDVWTGLLQPLHGFIVIDAIDSRPRISNLDPDSLKAYLVAHPGVVRGDTLTAGVVLEAGPPQLRAFLASYLQRPGVLSSPTTFVRKTP